ncbi:DUF4129 domain-containing protein [Paenibacillus radicis (ex Gao et al. 2016)]|uniref:Protein-glutamine gamma-glutamyltransferase-like C-terminal domain-containing protein n=1 Tax=Paenibacillus radicis (ex Gao et al. 2016) TaxID=1737354 RepID=A0A917HT35_9BACL|nr:DUF4129 domain-containing protein [Paenibacillus radicis (ex Gao et al. 2016)]GGG88395.1 hypothetical protein GCM10010918_53650 [Paenibacillus radicis (ex Gao et al. 2016)]
MIGRFNSKSPIASIFKGAVEVLFCLPLLLLIVVHVFSDQAVLLWLLTLPLCYGIGAFLKQVLKFNRLIYRLTAAIIIGAAHGGFIAVWDLGENAAGTAIVLVVLLVIISMLAVFRGISQMADGWTKLFPNTAMIFCIFAFVAIQPFKGMLPHITPYGNALTVCGIAAVILFFFLTNERLISDEAGSESRSRTAAGFRRQNRWMTALVVLVLIIISLFRQLQQLLESAFRAIGDAIMRWLNRPTEPIEPSTEPPPALDPALPIEPAEPSAWALLLEAILRIAGTILLIIVLGVVLFFIGRGLYRLLRKTMDRLLARSSESRELEGGYVDEVESLMSSSRWGRGRKGKADKEPGWSELRTGADRIRYLYRRFIKGHVEKGYSYQPHLTPKETAADLLSWQQRQGASDEEQSLVRAYEEVRYGEREMDAQSAEQLKKRLDESSRKSFKNK